MKTEQILMCALFVLCSVMIFTMLVTMLTMPVAPASLAHSTMQSLPLAAFTAGS